jgi:hydroxymethylpyrimidine pyrophosphatase-like HAD family hydrolase
MLKWAGVSAVVANASQDARLAARHVFASNDDGGVAGFVDALLLDEEQ